MPHDDQTKVARIRGDLDELANGPGADVFAKVLDALAYALSMSPTERLRRKEEACRMIGRLDAVAARHRRKAVTWQIHGPAPRDR